MSNIAVLIVDDEALVRTALRVFIDDTSGMNVVGEARDGEGVEALCDACAPDVALIDLRMPKRDGISTIRALHDTRTAVRCIALTTFSGDSAVADALEAGARGYLVKDSEPDELVAAIRTVYRGGYAFSARAAEQLLTGAARSRALRGDGFSDSEKLSDRELDVVVLLAEGKSNLEIAHELFLSEATVKSHLRRIMTKWGVRDRVQVLVRASRHGLVVM
ncbi:response regulator [Microbacterium sp.]|uniref:response regulator n=1 Tax=Microbacterium sp. TaxID=51671 RepID=UPI003A8B0587